MNGKSYIGPHGYPLSSYQDPYQQYLPPPMQENPQRYVNNVVDYEYLGHSGLTYQQQQQQRRIIHQSVYSSPVSFTLKKKTTLSPVKSDDDEDDVDDNIGGKEEIVVKKEEEQGRLFDEDETVDFNKMDRAMILEYLSKHIMFQIKGVMNLTTRLFLAKSTPIPGLKQILITTIAGATGCGKSDAARKIATLLKMDKGQENEKHFIYYTFGNLSQKSSHNIIAGVSQGYVGFNHSRTLVDKLVAAKDYQRIQKEKQTKNKITDDDEIASLYPKIIYVFIDEFDKAGPSIMDSLNSLFAEGYLKSLTDDRIVFELPQQTTLFICLTTNFASEDFIKNPNMGYSVAIECINNDMRAKGYTDWDRSRLGLIIPFFAIDEKNAHTILKAKLKLLMKQNIARHSQYTKECFIMSDEDQNALVSYCVQKGYSQRSGLRQSVLLLTEELTSNSELQQSHLEQYVDKQYIPLMPPPQLKFNSIKYKESLNTETLRKENPDIGDALEDKYNQITIEQCLESGSSIDYLSLTHNAMTKKFVGILTPIIATINFNTHIYNHHTTTDPNILNNLNKTNHENESLKRKLEDINYIIVNDAIDEPQCKVRKISECLNSDDNSRVKDHFASSKALTLQKKQRLSPSTRYTLPPPTDSDYENDYAEINRLMDARSDPLINFHDNNNNNNNNNYHYDDNYEDDYYDDDKTDYDNTVRICAVCNIQKSLRMFLNVSSSMGKNFSFPKTDCNSCRKNIEK
jgi:hypothetical protein